LEEIIVAKRKRNVVKYVAVHDLSLFKLTFSKKKELSKNKNEGMSGTLYEQKTTNKEK
jgi:hypothetical protein